jgi:hypothetical protein
MARACDSGHRPSWRRASQSGHRAGLGAIGVSPDVEPPETLEVDPMSPPMPGKSSPPSGSPAWPSAAWRTSASIGRARWQLASVRRNPARPALSEASSANGGEPTRRQPKLDISATDDIVAGSASGDSDALLHRMTIAAGAVRDAHEVRASGRISDEPARAIVVPGAVAGP